MIDAVLSWPTNFFSIALAGCLAWWLSSMVFGGFDSGDSSGGDGGDGFGESGDVDGGSDAEGGIGRLLGALVPFGALPVAWGATLLFLFSWAVSVVASVALRGDAKSPSGVLAAGVFVAALVAGWLATKGVARVAQPAFVVAPAPTRADLVGTFARVRNSTGAGSRGDALVIAGPHTHAQVDIRGVDDVILERGAVVLLIEWDEPRGSYVATRADPDLVPTAASHTQ